MQPRSASSWHCLVGSLRISRAETMQRIGRRSLAVPVPRVSRVAPRTRRCSGARATAAPVGDARRPFAAPASSPPGLLCRTKRRVIGRCRSTLRRPCSWPVFGPLDIAAASSGSVSPPAQLERARVLWLPTIYLGADYFVTTASSRTWVAASSAPARAVSCRAGPSGRVRRVRRYLRRRCCAPDPSGSARLALQATAK